MRVLELRHAECESPGTYLTGLDSVAEVTTVRMWRQPLPPDPDGYAAILVMGGPMGANDGAQLPWIDAEISFLRAAIAANIPVWGTCLGSQLLARALDAEVYTGPDPEIGVTELIITDDGHTDPVWSIVTSPTIPVLQWHYDTFALPDGATLLASSAAYPNQLFRHGNCYGLQFHLEVDAPLFDHWLDVPANRNELVEALGPQAPIAVFTDVERAQAITAPLAATVIRRWFDHFARLAPETAVPAISAAHGSDQVG